MGVGRWASNPMPNAGNKVQQAEAFMIEVIAGTNRPGSATLRMANLILEMYHAAGVDAQILDLAQLPPEIFNPTCYAEKPASFKPFSDRVLRADGLHVVVPEYNGSFPGVLKYFVDMLKFPESFEQRPVAFTGVAAGVWGAFRAVEQLQLVFGYRNAILLPERVWIPAIHQKWAADGKGLNDADLTKSLTAQTASFATFVKRNGGLAAKAS